jgi:hypothetical protein
MIEGKHPFLFYLPAKGFEMNSKRAKQLRRDGTAKATNGAAFECLTTKRLVKNAFDADGNPTSMVMPVTSSWQEGTSRRLYQDSKSA